MLYWSKYESPRVLESESPPKPRPAAATSTRTEPTARPLRAARPTGGIGTNNPASLNGYTAWKRIPECGGLISPQRSLKIHKGSAHQSAPDTYASIRVDHSPGPKHELET